MNIGIIGAGNIGSALTKRFTDLGHTVRVANSRNPETLGELAEQTGATAVWAKDAAEDAEIVVVTIPLAAIPALPDGVLEQRVVHAPVIDTNNYYPQRDGKINAIEDGMTESRWVSDQLGVPVIKAFNNIYAEHLVTKVGQGIALPVSGDDETAKEIVVQLIEEMGFDVVNVGTLDESWRQQPGSPCYGTDLDVEGLKKALLEASPERPADFRA